MTEDEIIVKYYYKKLPFNMKVEKEIDKITVNGEETTYSGDNKFAKVEIKYKDINNTSVEVSYKIKVTNTEKVKGTAILEELIPDGFEFANDKSDEKWKEQNGKIVLETEEIKPGETKEYTITLSWKADENNKGEKANTVKITDTENKARYEETTRDDNKDTAIIEIKLQKTIFDISKNNVKTGDLIIFSIAAILIAGVALIVVIKKEK